MHWVCVLSLPLLAPQAASRVRDGILLRSWQASTDIFHSCVFISGKATEHDAKVLSASVRWTNWIKVSQVQQVPNIRFWTSNFEIADKLVADYFAEEAARHQSRIPPEVCSSLLRAIDQRSDSD